RTAHRCADGLARRAVLPDRAAPAGSPRRGGSLVVLAASNLSCGYRGRAVLRGVSLTVQPGELFAILGPNGAGKPTLLRALARLLRPLAGQVTLDGRDLWALPASAVASALAFSPQVLSPDWPFS